MSYKKHIFFTRSSRVPNEATSWVYRGIRFIILICFSLNASNLTQKIEAYKQTIAANPASLETYPQLIETLKQNNQYHEAIHYAQILCAKEPQSIKHPFDLGCLLIAVGQVQQAVAEFNKILAVSRQSSVLYNIGYAYKMADNIDAALDYYQQALAVKPDNDTTIFAVSRAYLHKGDFINGWINSERYLKSSGKYAESVRTFITTNKLAGKHIVCIPEGGLGDTLQFIRYAQEFKNRGARVTAVVQKPLVPLISLCPFIDAVIPIGSPRPTCDGVITYMSAPPAFNSDETTLPKTIPYLFADKELIKIWQKRLENEMNYKVGICWQADVYNDSSRLPVARRGIPLNYFFQLADTTRVQFYSLQMFDGVEQLKNIPADFPVTVFNEDFDKKHGSFMDTAAVIMNLDLVITVDTAIAHLAGGLGKPVWLLLPYATDWRWISHRTDSPWYPTMRIFKQPKPFDWQSVIDQVKRALRDITI